MGAPTVSKYDIYLGDKSSINGYRTRQLVRDSAPLVASKFSTGSQGQSDLSLNKVESLESFSGGMFQRTYGFLNKTVRHIGIFNKFDEQLYPTVPRSAATAHSPFGSTQAKAENSEYSFMSAGYTAQSQNHTALFKLTPGATDFTEITLPAVLTYGASGLISGMTIHKGYLFIGASTVEGDKTSFRMKISDNTFQDIGAVSALYASLRGVLYTLNRVGGIYSVTNEFAASAATFTLIDTINTAAATDFIEFNGALWIATPSGLFRFDGIKAVKVLDLVVSSKVQFFNGALYFKSGNWLYKFDGTNITQLQQFTEGISGFTSSSDYLFIGTIVTTGTYETTDKSGTYTVNDQLRRLYMYDGVAFSLLDERTVTNSTLSYSNIFYTGTTLFDIHIEGGGQAGFYYQLGDIFKATSITSASKLDVTTSEFEAGFPAVYKSLDSIELDISRIIAGDSVAVAYSYNNGSGWSAWQTAGTITSTSVSNKIEITDDTKKLFKKIKFSVVATLATGSTLTLKSVSWSYTLQPRIRWRWQGVLIAYGTTIIDRLGAATTQSANTLNNLITKAIKQKTPVYLLTPDYTVVKTTANAAATSIVLQGELPIYTDPYGEYPMVAIQNASSVWEILRVVTATYASATDQTTLVVEARGYLGITAAELTAGKEVHLCYKVYVTRLIRDSVELNDETYDEQSTKATQLKREFNIELTEV